MARDRDSESMKLIRENKRLKNENRSLRKALRKVAKGKDRMPILEELAEDLGHIEHEMEEEAKVPKCPECGQESLKITDLNVRIMVSCSNCGYRKTQKK